MSVLKSKLDIVAPDTRSDVNVTVGDNVTDVPSIESMIAFKRGNADHTDEDEIRN